jgi:hypothetical protein
MSNEPKKKETAQERQERRQNEIAALMESMDRTSPPADTELLKSLRLSVVESPQRSSPATTEADSSSGASVAPTPPALSTPVPHAVPVVPAPTRSVAIEGALQPPTVLLGAAIEEPVAADSEAPVGEVLIPATPDQFTVDATITEIARAAKAYPYPDVTGRGSVRISEDVFSRVTMIYAKARIDKILVLSYLLYSHVPAEGTQRVPKWILEPPPKVARRRILVFIRDEALARRLSDTAIRFGITEADIVENIVRKHIPEAPFQYKPKRRMRFSA